MSPSRIGIVNNKALFTVMALFTISLLMNIGGMVYVIIDSQNERTRICEAQNVIRVTIQEQIAAGRHSIPKLAYYKEHPDELKQALKDNDDAIARFEPIPCEKGPDIWPVKGLP